MQLLDAIDESAKCVEQRRNLFNENLAFLNAPQGETVAQLLRNC